MKKQVNVLTMVILIFTTLVVTTATAENPAIIRITKGDVAKTIDIQLANLQDQITSVVLQDMDGKCWYSERIWNENGYSKRLNLNGMPIGHYLCYVKNRGVFFTQSFRMFENGLVFYETVKAGNPETAFAVQTGSVHPAIVRITNEDANSLRLQLANLQEQPTSVQLNILGEGIAYQHSLTGEKALAQNINLKGMAAGAYFLYLSVGDASVIQFIEYSPAGIRLGALERLEKTPVKNAGLAQN